MVISRDGTLSDHLLGDGLAEAVIMSKSITGLERTRRSLLVYSVSIILLMVNERPNPAVSCTNSLAPVLWKEGIHSAKSLYILSFLYSHCPNIGLYTG